MIDKSQMLPLVLIALSVGSAVVCAYEKKYGSALYWASAAVINFAVAFLIPKLG